MPAREWLVYMGTFIEGHHKILSLSFMDAYYVLYRVRVDM